MSTLEENKLEEKNIFVVLKRFDNESEVQQVEDWLSKNNIRYRREIDSERSNTINSSSDNKFTKISVAADQLGDAKRLILEMTTMIIKKDQQDDISIRQPAIVSNPSKAKKYLSISLLIIITGFLILYVWIKAK